MRLHVLVRAAIKDDVYGVKVEIDGAFTVKRFQAELPEKVKIGRGGRR